MSTLRTTYGLSYGTIIKAQVTAYNDYGWGSTSAFNTAGAIIYDVPVAMATSFRGDATTISQIQVNWTALTASTDIRATSILSYNLQWDAGTNGVTFTDLTGYSTESTSTSFTVTSGIVSGKSY